MEDVEKQLPHDISSAEDISRQATYEPEVTSDSAQLHDAAVRRSEDLIDPADPGEARVADIRRGSRILQKLRAAETWLDRKLNFEAMGVERIPEDKRRPPSVLNVRTRFLPCFPIFSFFSSAHLCFWKVWGRGRALRYCFSRLAASGPLALDVYETGEALRLAGFVGGPADVGMARRGGTLCPADPL